MLFNKSRRKAKSPELVVLAPAERALPQWVDVQPAITALFVKHVSAIEAPRGKRAELKL